ncbi:MAG: acyl-CoA thioesterase [Pseudomonadota bacterium]
MAEPAARRRLGRLWQRSWPEHPALRADASCVVPFQDADPTGMVWHGNYFRYYDLARIALLDALEFDYRRMAAAGQIWPIVETQVRYLRSVRYGETLRIEVRMVEWEFRLRLHYLIYNSSDELVNEAVTVQVPVAAADEQLIIGAPKSLCERIEARLTDA